MRVLFCLPLKQSHFFCFTRCQVKETLRDLRADAGPERWKKPLDRQAVFHEDFPLRNYRSQ